MGNYALIVQIFLGLLVIFFFATIFFSARNQRWPHLLFLSFTFLAAIGFVVYAAMELKTQQAWRTEVNKMTLDLEKQTQAIDNLRFGEAAKSVQEANLRSVKAEIGRILLDRGRVWREVQPGNFDGTSVTVQTVPAVLPEGQAAKPNNLEQGAILYLFKEVVQELNGRQIRVPGAFLGEFKATAVTESSVTLSPSVPLDAQQLAQIRQNDAPSWVLYEVMPLDGHEFFAGLTEEQLRVVMPQPNGMPDADYNAMIQSYLRTGGPADEANDPPGTQWVKVKMLADVSVDVDNPDMMPAPDSLFFDREGRAIAQRLRRDGPVVLKQGSVAVVDPETAQKWIDAKQAEKMEVIYQRPLNDYAQAFQSHFLRRKAVQEKIDAITRDNEVITTATAQAVAQLAKVQDEIKKLTEDKANFTIEQEVMAQFLETLTGKSEALRQQLRDTFQENLKLADELAAMQKQLADEINQRELAKTAAIR